MRQLPIVLFLALPSRASATECPNLLGIVEIPALFGTRAVDGPPGLVAPAQPKPVEYRDTPAGKISGRIAAASEVASLEYGYEEAGAQVCKRGKGHYGVALASGRIVWVAETAVGNFHTFEQLILNGLSHFTKSWDGSLWTRPGAGRKVLSRPKAGTAPDDAPSVDAKAARVHKGQLWFEIEIPKVAPCTESPQSVVGRGWVPAFGPGGRPNLWFSSRGC